MASFAEEYKALPALAGVLGSQVKKLNEGSVHLKTCEDLKSQYKTLHKKLWTMNGKRSEVKDEDKAKLEKLAKQLKAVAQEYEAAWVTLKKPEWNADSKMQALKESEDRLLAKTAEIAESAKLIQKACNGVAREAGTLVRLGGTEVCRVKSLVRRGLGGLEEGIKVRKYVKIINFC